MKRADSSGARFAAIIGDDEVQNEQVSLKPLRDSVEQKMLTVARAAELVSGSAG